MTGWEKIRTKVYLFLIGIWRRMTLGVRVILVDGEKVFLVRHSYISGWHFPGGGVDPGETAETGAARELLEETGYRVERPLVLHGIFLNAGASNRDHVLVYCCSEFSEARPFSPSSEIAEGRWFFRHDLPETATPGTKARLAEIFDGRALSSIW